jgi:predicted lipoprotein with Yx(FWY)xxD motif
MVSLNHGPVFPAWKNTRPTIAFLITVFSICLLFSCNDKDDPPPAAEAKVQLRADAQLGSVLTDGTNRTLYSFANDFNGENNCSGGCANVWPVFYAGDNLIQSLLATGLDLADFATVTTGTGAKQTTYKGWPLYYYAPLVGSANTPEAAGEAKGEGIAGFWHVAKPDYTIRLLNAQLVGSDGKNYTSAYVEGTGKTLYFTDANGATIYTFSKDSSSNNNFTKADFSNNSVWPIYETDKVVVPSTLDKTLFASIDVFGKKQLTYKGWPLYYFGADNKLRGSNKGVSFPVPGGIWPVAVKDAPIAPVP